MKILQLCTKVPYPPKDGGAAAVFAISKMLAGDGHHVTIMAVNPPKHYVPLDSEHLPENIKIVPVELNTSLCLAKALFNLAFSYLPYHISRFSSGKFKKKLLEILKKNDFDIVQLEGIYLGTFIKEIRKYSKARIFLRAHNVEHILWNDIRKGEKNIFKKFFLSMENIKLQFFEINLLQNVDGIIPISQPDLTIFSKYTTSKSLVIPFGVDENNFLPEGNIHSKNNSTPDLFYIGALDWYPNQKAIIWFVQNVWPGINSAFPELIFHIAGRNAPKFLIKIIEAAQNVHFHGEVKESSGFMRGHSIMVAPLFTGSGIRVKIIEALSYGIPVIASAKALEGIPAIHQKHIVIANTPQEYCNNIKDLLVDKVKQDLLSKNGKELIERNYLNRKFIRDLINFYEN